MKVSRKKLKQLLEFLPLESRNPDILKGQRNKFGAVRTEYNGRTYASKAEADHAAKLDACGIRWKPQPRFHLGCPENTYVADFAIENEDGKLTEVHEVKGRRTAKFNHDVRLWRRYGPCPLLIFTKGALSETILPKFGNQ